MLPRSLILIVAIVSLSSNNRAWGDAPCAPKSTELTSAIECAKENEPAYRSATRGKEEAEELKSSAYRLINPELELEYLDGNSLGVVQKEKNATLLFTFELGGKRSARAKILEGEGLSLRADAFDQAIQSLTDIGGSILRLKQLEAERGVLQESLESFRKVISLYRSRGSLPPEQKVSLHTFELILIGYEEKLIEVEKEVVRFQKRVESIFGSQIKGAAFDLKKWSFNPSQYEASFDQWIESTPEMLRVRSESLKAEGEHDMSVAFSWPDLSIGPSIAQATQGPVVSTSYGLRVSFPIPLLTWNAAERTSKKITSARAQAQARWNRQDVVAKYKGFIASMSRMNKVLKDSPTPEDIQKKHSSTESLYQRGMISGALMIESHRAFIEHYEARHAMQLEYLKGLLTLQHLERASQ